MLRCRVAGVEAVEAQTRHAFPRHWHEQYGIGLVQRGAQKSRSGRGMVEAFAGDTITVNPGEIHDGLPIDENGRSWRMLYFDPAMLGAAFLDMSEGRSGSREFALPVMRDDVVAGQFLRLFDAMTAPDSSDLVRETRLFELLAGVVAERDEAGDHRSVPLSIRRARALIDDQPARAFTLGELAGESGLSRFQLLRGFCRATGLTPHAYLVQRRVELARRLIAQGTKLAEAALAAGFADQSHMTRTFVRKYGVSPGHYAAAVG